MADPSMIAEYCPIHNKPLVMELGFACEVCGAKMCADCGELYWGENCRCVSPIWRALGHIAERFSSTVPP